MRTCLSSFMDKLDENCGCSPLIHSVKKGAAMTQEVMEPNNIAPLITTQEVDPEILRYLIN